MPLFDKDKIRKEIERKEVERHRGDMLQAQLNQSNAELNHCRTALNQSNAQISQCRTALNKSNAELNQCKTALNKSNAELNQCQAERENLQQWKEKVEEEKRQQERKRWEEEERTPWRVTDLEWTDDIRKELQQWLKTCRLTQGKDISSVRILMVGEIGAGKSSTINTIKSAMHGAVRQSAHAGSDTTSTTLQMKIYPLSTNEQEEANLELADIMGMEWKEGCGLLHEDVEAIMDGHVPDKYQFNTHQAIDASHPDYIHNPSIREKMHVAAIVVNGSSVTAMDPGMRRQIHTVIKAAKKRGIHVAVIVTHIDVHSVAMADSVVRVHYDPEVRDLVSTCAELFGIVESHIFPIKNYYKEMQVRLDVDILGLYTLKSLVSLAEETLEFERRLASIKAKPLLTASWRQGLEKFDKQELDGLKKFLTDFDINEDSDEEEGDRVVFILLLGLHNAGKSSYINTVQSAFFSRISDKAPVQPGQMAVITKELRKYQIRESRGRKGKVLNVELLDTMGLHCPGIHAKDVERLLEGSVPEKHAFSTSQPLPADVLLETKENQPQVMALVVDGSTIQEISSDRKKELKDIIKLTISKDIATVVLVTHIDRICPRVKQDIEQVYYSSELRDVVAYVSNELGVKESSVFPVQNYVSEHQPCDAMDILALRALKEMLIKAEDNIFS